MAVLVDWLVVLVLIAGVLAGIHAGVVRSVYALLGFGLSLLFAIGVHQETADALADAVGAPGPIARSVAFVEALLSAYLVTSLAGRKLLGGVVGLLRSKTWVKWVERVTGSVPAACLAVLACTVGLSAAVLLPIGASVRAEVDASMLGSALVRSVLEARPALDRFVPSEARHALFETMVASDVTRPLDVPPDVRVLPDAAAERALLDLVATERARRGVQAIDPDPVLARVARAHSTEMYLIGYFGHRSPVHGSLEDRLRAGGSKRSHAREEIAHAALVTTAVWALMDDPGAQASLLDGDATTVGIGVVTAEPYGLLVTVIVAGGDGP